MIKTSTKQHPEKEQVEEIYIPQPEDLFYNQIRPDLNKLMRDPADEVIEAVLVYSRKK